MPPPPVTEIPVGEPLAATRLKVELVTPTRFSPKPGTWLRSRSLSMSPPTSARSMPLALPWKMLSPVICSRSSSRIVIAQTAAFERSLSEITWP